MQIALSTAEHGVSATILCIPLYWSMSFPVTCVQLIINLLVSLFSHWDMWVPVDLKLGFSCRFSFGHKHLIQLFSSEFLHLCFLWHLVCCLWSLMPSDALCFLQTGTWHNSCSQMLALRAICWLELRRDKALAFIKFLYESGTLPAFITGLDCRNGFISLNVAGLLFVGVKTVQNKMTAVLAVHANTFKSAF